MIAPTLHEIATEYAGQMAIAKLNVDENPETPIKFGVMGIPTLILFKNGKAVERVTGALPKDRLVSILSPHLD
jgi:thioredoxin 1